MYKNESMESLIHEFNLKIYLIKSMPIDINLPQRSGAPNVHRLPMCGNTNSHLEAMFGCHLQVKQQI